MLSGVTMLIYALTVIEGPLPGQATLDILENLA
jgi:hypothetical protein